MSLVAKLEGNSLPILPPRNRCLSRLSRLINRAACIPLVHLYILSIEISAPWLPSFFFSFSFLILSFPPIRCEETSPPQSSISDRYRSNVALPAIGIDRCSFSSMIIVGSMFHAILKLYYEPLANLGAWEIFGHGESVASLTLLSTGLSRVIRHQTADRCYLLYNVVRGAGKRDVVQSEGAYTHWVRVSRVKAIEKWADNFSLI